MGTPYLVDGGYTTVGDINAGVISSAVFEPNLDDVVAGVDVAYRLYGVFDDSN